MHVKAIASIKLTRWLHSHNMHELYVGLDMLVLQESTGIWPN
jgi:hypothetical protein